MAITDDTITATTKLSVTDGPGGSVFAEIIPAANKAYFLGKVGIGALNPVNALDVEGALAVGAGYSGSIAAPENGLIVEGNVGIGTPSPMTKLEVSGTIKATALEVTNTVTANTFQGNGAALTNVNDTTKVPLAGGTMTGVLTLPSNGLTVGGSQLVVSGGKVGVGTSTPGAKLDVAGDIKVDGAIIAPEGTLRDNGGGWVRTYGNTGWYSQTHGGGWYMTDSEWIRSYGSKSMYHNAGALRTDGTLQVGPDGSTLNVPKNGTFAYRTNVLFANTAGRVGIGVTDPTARLEIDSPWSDWIFLRQKRNTEGGGGFHVHNPWKNTDDVSRNRLEIGYRTSTGTDRWELLVVHSTGNVGVGRGFPAFKLDVNGPVRAAGFFNFSDKRSKKNIASLKGALDRALKLKGVSFEWRRPEDKKRARKQFGVLAQDVEKIFPELVHDDPEGQKSVDYAGLIPVLIEAMKQQHDMYKALDRRLASIEEKLKASSKSQLKARKK